MQKYRGDLCKVRIGDELFEYPVGTSFLNIALEQEKEGEDRILLVSCDGELRELSAHLEDDCELRMITAREKPGYLTLERSTVFVMMKAFHEILGVPHREHVIVDFSAGGGLFCRIIGMDEVPEELLHKVEMRMREISEAAIPLRKSALRTENAVRLFREQGMTGKEKLFRFRRSSRVNVYNLDGYRDYYYGYMVPDTSYVSMFSLSTYEHGFILKIPTMEDPKRFSEAKVSWKVFRNLYDTSIQAEKVGLCYVAGLNEYVARVKGTEVILWQEALMEKQIGDIAQQISEQNGVRFVMIAGPSSSGKTTFSNRLATQLRALGLIPHPIEADNYFKPREETPRDENGEFDFECLEAMDTELFNRDMSRLLQGETVELPTYNFLTGNREYRGNRLTLGEGDLLLVEGIHCLNEKFSGSLPAESKLKIYISCLTQINIDEHNRIPSSDARLLRRMTRDARIRGYSAEHTIERWPSVRRGEEKYIFPYQDSADIVFNSAAIYETAVLKPYAEALLFGVPQESPAFTEAKKLLKFLDYFLTIPADNVPATAILREFIGGGIYKV
ncbi:MAG: nucleoside kinase [Stomatobaculum sp.]|nr:nucleoside kinase [Stomatobaculum sp.]